MPDHEPSAVIRTPFGAATAVNGLTGEAPPFPVPDHTLMRRVGKGAYGEVWLARNTLGTWRAVKFIRRSSFDDDRPFERELAGIQRFEPISRSHESQLNILHVGRAEDGFYYVMELADDMGRGQDIDEATYIPRNLRSELHVRGRLPVGECLRIGLALTTALEHLHRHDLVHRDIKPSNIVYVSGIPKLADIGLVARAEATISFVGTEGFLPPEGPGTRQADIYSLGKVLYELSTGHDRQQFPELPTNIVELPDRAELSELNEVLLKACHGDPKERYQTAAEMHADLALLESGRSVVHLRGLERRLRFVQRAGAVVTVIAALAAGLYFWQTRQTGIVRDLAAEKDKLAGENRERIIRLDIANGVRLLNDNEPSAALLWFADALPLVTNNPAVEEIHRIRVQQVLQQTPRLSLSVSCSNSVAASAWSPDGRRFVITTSTSQGDNYVGQVRLQDASDGHLIWVAEFPQVFFIGQVRFSRDGKRLLVSSSPEQTSAGWGEPTESLAVVLDADSGHALYPLFASNLVWAAFSTDERWLALARSNYVIQVVNAKDGTPVAELKGHTNRITMLTFSADGGLLASASEDHSARLWRLPSGKEAVPAMLHDRPIRRAVLSDDASRLATATIGDQGDGDEGPFLVQVWDVYTGSRIGDAITQPSMTYALFFGRGSGNHLFTAGDLEKVQVWDARSAPLRRLGELNLIGGRSWEISPDGDFLVMGDDGGQIDLFRSSPGEPMLFRFKHTGYVESIHFSPDGKRLLTTSDDGTAKIWSLRREAESARLLLTANHPDSPAEQARPRGRTPGPIPMVLKDGWLHLVDPDQLVEIQRLKHQPTNAPFASWVAGSTGRFWACLPSREAALDNSPQAITLWTRQDGGFRSLQLLHPQNVALMQFNADDSRLVTWAGDGFIRFWRTRDGTIERSVSVPESKLPLRQDILLEPFDSDCRKLILLERDTNSQRYHLQLFDLVPGQSPSKNLWGRGSYRMRLSPDGTYLGSVGGDQQGTVIDLKTGELAVPPFKHGGYLLDLDWSPDGRRVITAGLSSEIKLWAAAAGKMLLSPMATTTTVTAPARSARWSADGRFIVTRSDDNQARVWDASTAEAITPPLRHSVYIRWVCITAANRLITASDPNLLRAWDLKPTPLPADVIADYARFLSGRKLSASGALLPLKPEELEELNRSLRARAPQLFE